MFNWHDGLKPYETEKFERVFKVWQSQIENGDVPRRKALRPVELGQDLPDCFIIQKDKWLGGRFRFAGNTLNDAFGMDMRAIPLPSLVSFPLRTTMQTLLDKMFGQKQKLFLQYSRDAVETGSPLSLCMFPLKDEADITGLALGVVSGLPKNATLGCYNSQLTGMSENALEQRNAFEFPKVKKMNLREPGANWGAPTIEKGARKPERPYLRVVK